jgi:hypothetical protein
MNTFFVDWLDSQGVEPAAVYGVHNRGAAEPEAPDRSRADRVAP